MFFHDLGPKVCFGDSGYDDEMAYDEAAKGWIIREAFRFNELRDDPELQSIHLASFITSHFYPDADDEADRMATELLAKVVPSFYLLLHAAVARASEIRRPPRKCKSNGECYASWNT